MLLSAGQSPDSADCARPAAVPCGLHQLCRRRSRVERDTGNGAASRGGREGTAVSGPGVQGHSSPLRQCCPPPPALLTGTLQVVARLHGWSLSRLRPPYPPPSPLHAAGARVSERFGAIAPGRGSFRRRRPALGRTVDQVVRVRARRGLRDGAAFSAVPPPP